MKPGGLLLGNTKTSYYATTHYFTRNYYYRRSFMACECFYPYGLQNQKDL